MPSITVFDCAGVQQTIQTLPVPGQATASASSPVVIASDQSARLTQTATIASAASVSGTIDVGNQVLVGFVAPAAWTAAALTLEVSTDGTNWVTSLYDFNGTLAGQWGSIVASAGYTVDLTVMSPWRYVRLRSGTAASPVAQGASRAFTLITRPMF